MRSLISFKYEKDTRGPFETDEGVPEKHFFYLALVSSQFAKVPVYKFPVQKRLTLCILMASSFWINTISLG